MRNLTNVEEIDAPKAGFNIEDIAYSKADIGTFPFFTLPKGLKEMNDNYFSYYPLNIIEIMSSCKYKNKNKKLNLF